MENIFIVIYLVGFFATLIGLPRVVMFCKTQHRPVFVLICAIGWPVTLIIGGIVLGIIKPFFIKLDKKPRRNQERALILRTLWRIQDE